MRRIVLLGFPLMFTLATPARADEGLWPFDMVPKADIAKAHYYAPSDSVTQALAGQIEQATIRREVVVANYPLYGSMATSIDDSLKTVVSTNAQIAKELKLFRADYDTDHLTKAIVESYDLEDEAHRGTQRLVSYRALVQSGAVNRQAAAAADAPNLLPIP